MTLEELEKYLEKCIESEEFLFWYETNFDSLSHQWFRVSFTTPNDCYHSLNFIHDRVLKPTEETKVTSIKLTYLQDQLKYQLGRVKDLKNKSEISDIKRSEIEVDKKEVLLNLTKCVKALEDEIEDLEVLAESFRWVQYPGKKGETKYLAAVWDEYINSLKNKILPGIKNLKASVETI